MSAPATNRIAIIIASTGRAVELGRWINHMQRQTVSPAALVYAVVTTTDLPDWDETPDGVRVIVSDPGLPVQRNAGLEAVIESSDIIAYFDDDYVPSSYCIEGIDSFFRTHLDVVGATGTLLADGINSAGIAYSEASELIMRLDTLPRTTGIILHDVKSLYGCNMVFRTKAIGQDRFDEELPLYAWQEDVDFTARLGKRGRMVKTNAFYGVHQGVKGARLPGTKLGYSQIANPIYLVRKGTLSVPEATRLIVKNVLKNHARSLFPEPWIDRLGRCRGNWLAIADVLSGKDHPKKILLLPR